MNEGRKQKIIIYKNLIRRKLLLLLYQKEKNIYTQIYMYIDFDFNVIIALKKFCENLFKNNKYYF